MRTDEAGFDGSRRSVGGRFRVAVTDGGIVDVSEWRWRAIPVILVWGRRE